MEQNQKTKILVIGAGPAGLSTLRGLQQLQPSEKFEIVCIEKQSDWSGQWNYTWRTGVDEYGQPVHSSMYSQLWTNIPKEAFQFPDYPLKEHFGKPTPSYLPRDVFKGYFMKRFEKSGLRKFVRFNQIARNVQYLQDSSKFKVRITDLSNNTEIVDIYDYVAVAVGRFSVPNFPDLQGINSFKGKVLHSHDIREFSAFKEKNILIIGGSLSAEDLTLQLFKYGAKKIIWTYRKLKFETSVNKMPQNIEMRHLPKSVSDFSAHFENGDSRQIDTIIFCTGYIHSFPFMDESLRLKFASVSHPVFPPNLYKGVVFGQNRRLFYVGMGSYVISQLIFDIQGYLVRDIISGKHQLPTDLTRDETDLLLFSKLTQVRSIVDALKLVCEYARHLMSLTNYHPEWNIEQIVKFFVQMNQHRKEDIFAYRDHGGFQSIVTGQVSEAGSTPWLKVMDSEQRPGTQNQELEQFFSFDTKSSH